MGRRIFEESHIRNLTKTGAGSYTVTLPVHLVRQLKWREGQQVVVRARGEGFTVTDFKPGRRR